MLSIRNDGIRLGLKYFTIKRILNLNNVTLIIIIFVLGNVSIFFCQNQANMLLLQAPLFRLYYN